MVRVIDDKSVIKKTRQKLKNIEYDKKFQMATIAFFKLCGV